MKKYLSLLVLFFLFSCTTQNPYPVTNSSVSSAGNNGFIVVSFKDEGLFSARASYYIRSVDDSSINFNINRGSDTAKRYSSGWVDVLELPAGSYEVYDYLLVFKNNYAEQPTKHFSIPFKVNPGKINYLGEIQLSDNKFHFKDMKDRDMTDIYTSHPYLSGLLVNYTIVECKSDCLTKPKQYSSCKIIKTEIEPNSDNEHLITFKFFISTHCDKEESANLCNNELEGFKTKNGYSDYEIIKNQNLSGYIGRKYSVKFIE